MHKRKFNVRVSDKGQLQFYDVDLLNKALLSSKGFFGYIEFRKVSNDSSMEQLFNLYNWWVDLISKEMGETKDNVDDTLCTMLLYEEKWNPIKNQLMRSQKDKVDLTYQEWIDFLKKINDICMKDLNFVDSNGQTTLPIPNNLKNRL